MYFEGDLAQLKVLCLTQAGDQLLQLLDERIAFLNIVQILYERVTVRVILEWISRFTIVCN